MSDTAVYQTRGFGAARKPSKTGVQTSAFGVSPQLMPCEYTPAERKAMSAPAEMAAPAKFPGYGKHPVRT